MELSLNLGWLLLSLAAIVLWHRAGRSPHAPSRGTQLVALALLLLVLFPVISVTDDFVAAHNPAEADSCMRRNELTAQPHTIVPEVPVLLPMREPSISLAFLGYAPSHDLRVLPSLSLPRSPFFNRPPPAC